MITRIDEDYMYDVFHNRSDKFSRAACSALLQYYDEVCGEDEEFEPEDIEDRWEEYGGDAYYSIWDLAYDNSNLLEEDPRDYINEDKLYDDLVEALEERTSVLRTSDGSIVVDTDF